MALHGSMCVQYREMYDKSINQPEEFWGEIASEFKWENKVRTSAR